MSRPANTGLLIALTPLLGCLAGCPHMRHQPSEKPLGPEPFFDNGQAARPLVKGTVPHGMARVDTTFYTGKLRVARKNGKLAGRYAVYARTYPFPITMKVLERGRQRFNIFCTPCHGRAGDGRGVVATRGFPNPPTYHSDELRAAPPGYFVYVISHGFGRMYDYKTRVSPRDRWAIAAYLKTLQFSQHATLQDVPPAERHALEAAHERR